jgi:hypothetical protein
MGGFIIQFLGLRALHWSITVITLSLTVVMTSVRAWIRRGMTSHGDYVKLSNGFEGLNVSTWIEDYIETLGRIRIAELKIPHRTVSSGRDVEWQAKPSRLLTATSRLQKRRRSDGPDYSRLMLTFRPDLPANVFTASTPTTGQFDLCTELGIVPTSAVEELALQVISAMEALAEHVTQRNNYLHSHLVSIVWDMLIVKTLPGLIQPGEPLNLKRNQIPQKWPLSLQRKDPTLPNSGGTIWRFTTQYGCRAIELVATLITLDAYARKPRLCTSLIA